MDSVQHESQWRGWLETTTSSPNPVTSGRLGADASVRNRWFPKVRSWFALGAPVELLSPLSVVRIVFLLFLIVVPNTLWAAGVMVGPAVSLTLVTLAVMLVLLRAKQLSHAAGEMLSAIAVLEIGILLWAGRDAAAVLFCATLLLPVAVFSGLFLRTRSVVALQCLAAGVVVAGTVPQWGVGNAIVFGLLSFQATLVTAVTVMHVARTARRRSTVDPDTGLPNGYGLAERLASWDDRGPYVVATVLLRGLGEAREALGYRVGTELLRRAVEDLGQVLPIDALIGRVEGDELVVARAIAVGGDQTERFDAAAAELAESLARAIGAGRYLVGAIEVSLRTHIGLAVAPTDGVDVTELVRRSSLAARRALASSRSCARWDGTTEALTAHDLELLADLRLAAGRDELWLAYQPLIAPTTGRADSVEALLRWTSPRHGTIPPGVFIPLAERTGLIDRLTEWVVHEALDAQVRWRRVGLSLTVSVNLSPVLLADPELPDWILGELTRRALPTDVLVLEVTESTAFEVVEAVDRLRPLHDRGVRVSIDDFGTGFTSMSVLPHLPVDELKVDQRFVQAALTSKADEAIVLSILELAHRLGLEAVAEGVEDEQIASQMCAFGFDLLQGFHYSRPLAESDLLDFIARQECLVPNNVASFATSV